MSTNFRSINDLRNATDRIVERIEAYEEMEKGVRELLEVSRMNSLDDVINHFSKPETITDP